MTRHESADDDAAVWRTALALAVLLTLWNNVANLWVGYQRWYVPLAVGLAAALLAVARRSGLTPRDLGLGKWRSGARWGGAVAGVAALGLAAAVALGPLRPVLADERVAGLGAGGLAYAVLVRVPFGTALLEEVAFRGVLLGAWSRVVGWRRAQLAQSAVFGLWHITPTWIALDANDVLEQPWLRAAAIVGAVVVTGVGGWVFGWLRGRSGSLLAPLLAHWGLNAAATLAGAAAARLA